MYFLGLPTKITLKISRSEAPKKVKRHFPRMEKSKTQEAMAEYKAMARDLAEEFQDKVANPTAEAFIEFLGHILNKKHRENNC